MTAKSCVVAVFALQEANASSGLLKKLPQVGGSLNGIQGEWFRIEHFPAITVLWFLWGVGENSERGP